MARARLTLGAAGTCLAAITVGMSGVVFAGCHRGGGGGGGSTPPATSTTPLLTSIAPAQGAPGDIITVRGFNFAPRLLDNVVLFRSVRGAAEILGVVIDVAFTGEDDARFGTASELRVVVPTGVQSGTCDLGVDTGAEIVLAGALAFTGTPQVVGVAIGLDGRRGSISYSVDSGATPASVEVYGFNMESIAAANVYDPLIDVPVASPGVESFTPSGAGSWTLPPGMTAVSIAVPADLSPPDLVCEEGRTPLRFELVATMPDGATLDLPPFEVQCLTLEAAGYVPPSITGFLLPSGVRSGDVAITYALFEDPARTRWDLVPEFLDPNSGDWIPCAPRIDAIPSNGDRVLTGGATSLPVSGTFVAPGEQATFVWDTRDPAGGLPAGRIVTRVRLVPASFEDWWALDFTACPTAAWESSPIVIDNDEPHAGTISESFTTLLHFDPDRSSGVSWDTATGTLSGGTAGAPVFGTGSEDIVLRAGSTYTFDTDTGAARLEGAAPEDLFALGNPGAALDPPEFWMRTFVVESEAIIEVAGRNALVIRASGTGASDDIVARIDGTFDLSGERGSRPDPLAVPPIGLGGRGGPGGTDGGAGGLVIADGTNTPGLITGEIGSVSADGPSGGGAGRNVSQLKARLNVNNPKPGPGGGGGHATAGGDGRLSFSQATTVQTPPGRGGSMRGDDRMTRLTGGAGGGGGAGLAFRGGVGAVLVSRAGGGGGGGGGAFQLTAAGSIAVGGSILCDGGLGEVGETGGPPSPGGGGSGGGILLQATGDITLDDTSLLRAMGARGGFIGAPANPQLAGGIGAPGRIRLEAKGAIAAAGLANFSGVQGPESAQLITLAVDPIDGGTGSDGVLDLTGSSGTFLVDTNRGEIFAPGDDEPLLTGASGDGEFHFEDLVIPAGVTLCARGDEPFILRVSGRAEVRGTIDVGGDEGGQVNLFAAPPLAGPGGAGGAGGGAGGAGGTATVEDVIHGARGGYPPPLPEEYRAYEASSQPGEPEPPPKDTTSGGFIVVPATGGESVRLGCGTPCRPGHGGGGGYALDGSDGVTPAVTDGVSGTGGRAFGTPGLRNPATGNPLRVGGTGGAGGGGSYKTGLTVPGSGGGGAGGFFQLSVDGQSIIGPTARILAEGGDAFQAPRGGSNGGAGAGGAILLEGENGMVFETGGDGSGPYISALGGTANLVPTADFDGVPGADYEGNGVLLAGDGAPGRILIRSRVPFNTEPAASPSPVYLQYPQATNAPAKGIFPLPSLGDFVLAESVLTWATTLPYRVVQEGGVSSAEAKFSHAGVSLRPASQPAGTSVLVRFEGAEESRDAPGTPGEFRGLVQDPSVLDGADYLRMTFFFYAPATGSVVPALDEITIPIDFTPLR